MLNLPFAKNEISENIKKCIKKFKNLESIELNLEGLQMGDELFRPIIHEIFHNLTFLTEIRLFLE